MCLGLLACVAIPLRPLSGCAVLGSLHAEDRLVCHLQPPPLNEILSARQAVAFSDVATDRPSWSCHSPTGLASRSGSPWPRGCCSTPTLMSASALFGAFPLLFSGRSFNRYRSFYARQPSETFRGMPDRIV
jgi:hypothetical protein